MPLTYRSWLHQCHPHSLSLHHRGRFQECSGFYCHTGACTPLRASYSWFHLIGPDTEVCRHTQASCLYTSCRERTGTGLEGWINKIHLSSWIPHQIRTNWISSVPFLHLRSQFLSSDPSLQSFSPSHTWLYRTHSFPSLQGLDPKGHFRGNEAPSPARPVSEVGENFLGK